MKIDVLLNHMWGTYTSLNPHIKEVLDLIESKESSKIINDHIALRTFNHKKVNKNKLAEFLSIQDIILLRTCILSKKT